MMLFKIILIVGILISTAHADCPITDNPREVISCFDYLTTVLYGAIVKDVSIVCKVASDVAKCLTEEMDDCFAAQISKAALNQAKELAENCCIDRNNTKCPIRGGLLTLQRCFAADSLVTLIDGQQKRIIELESGDKVLAYNDQTNEVISTDVIAMLDHQPNQYAIFKQLTTVSGRQLSLTSSHLILTDRHRYIMAKNIHVGMNIYIVNDNGLLTPETISNVMDVVKQGYVAPLTQQGTLIVNNIATSCYATINNHYLAHIGLAPMRWWYSLFGAMKHSDKTIGMHWFPNMLFEMTAFFMSSIIQN